MLTFLKVLINFGLMMKNEWLNFYLRFLATETMHIPQLKSNSAAKKLHCSNQPNFLIQNQILMIQVPLERSQQDLHNEKSIIRV